MGEKCRENDNSGAKVRHFVASIGGYLLKLYISFKGSRSRLPFNSLWLKKKGGMGNECVPFEL